MGLIFPALYAALSLVLDGYFRAEPFLYFGLLAGSRLVGGKFYRFFREFVPYFVFLYSYDCIRYIRQFSLRPEHIDVCSGVRHLEHQLFSGLTLPTPEAWASAHHSLALDLFFSAPYAVFAFVVLSYAAFLSFVDLRRMRRFLWTFAFANVVAYSFWQFHPVAPPWYVQQYGCQVNLAAPASPAGLLRAEEWLGFHYFSGFYGRSIFVFGAMPSLHCAYPMIGLLTAWKSISWKTRPIHILYAAWMFLASMYLAHHYFLDGAVGMTLAALSTWIVGAWFDRHPDGWPASRPDDQLPVQSPVSSESVS